MSSIKNIRNFAIIAHIDHGKSTISDCLIAECKGIDKDTMQEQVLDSMDLERERGITIKAQTVCLDYKAKDGNTYIINLIDTPGHVDFSYEVNRSMSACEGSVLIVDSSQGVEAQTLANVYHAIDNNHSIIVVLNKIDLPSADNEGVKKQIENVIGLDTTNCILASAKQKIGVIDILERIVTDLPAPQGDINKPLKALIVDSWYDEYMGVIILVKIKDGYVDNNMNIVMMSNNKNYIVQNVGIFAPQKKIKNSLVAGEIGFISANIRSVADCNVGDTITNIKNRCDSRFPNFKKAKPMVFSSIFPQEAQDFDKLRSSIEKLHLNDTSFDFSPETSTALGHGFRCGFLGLLHLEIILERLSREFNVDLISTSPSVIYKVYLKSGALSLVSNPDELPNIMNIDYFEEPWIKASIITPEKFIGAIINLCTSRRGCQIRLDCIDSQRSILEYKLPLAEVVIDFYDRLKSISSGYASFNWELFAYEKTDVVSLSILINGDLVDALSCLVHRGKSETRGRQICAKLKELIPRQMFKIAIQAAIGGKIIARETVSAFRKDVTAKCYGGDITRKKKLLEKQKKGKKKMYAMGNVNIPSNVFIDALKINND